MKTSLQKLIYKNTRIIISVVLFAIAASFFAITAFLCPNTTVVNFLINSSSGLFLLAVGIAFIEPLWRKQFNFKSTDISETAKVDVDELSNMLISYMTGPLGFNVMSYPDLVSKSKSPDEVIVLMLEDIQKQEMFDLLNKMSVVDWISFSGNIILIRQSLLETIQIYGDVLPREIFGKIISARKSFKKIDNMFGLFLDFFIKERSGWPKNDPKLRENILKKFAVGMDEYLKKVSELKAAIKEIPFEE
jgi:hypothetical protein